MTDSNSILPNDLKDIKCSKKRICLVSNTLNKYFTEFLSSSLTDEHLLDKWNSSENQLLFNKLISENSMKMKDRAAEEKRKIDKKNKIIEREKNKQIKRVEKAKSKPKNPFAIFKKEEQELIKKDNPKVVKKDMYKEIQKKWKYVKNTDKIKYYKELVDKQNDKQNDNKQ